MDGVKRHANAPLDLRAMIATPVVETVPEQLVQESFALPVVSEETKEWFSGLLRFGLIAIILLTTGATTLAYAGRLAGTSVKQVKKAASVAVTPGGFSNLPNVQGAAVDASRLQAILDNFTSGDRNDWGIVVTDLKTGATAQVNGSEQIESASLYKLFVAQGIYKAIDNGTMNYSDPAGGGSGVDIRTCLKYMITISDNTCGRALGVKLGWEAMNPSLAAAGFTATDMTGPAQRTSAADVALVFDRLYGGTLLSPNSSNEFMTLLKGQLVNDRLPTGLPAGTVIAHKTGDLDGYTHDAGIVFGPKTDYIVSVMSGPWATPATEASRFTDLSRQLYAYFEQ